MGKAIVFVIDDEASVRKALARLLNSAGLQVETFASADEFLHRPRYDGPGCLVLDVHMPGQGGLELQEAMASAHDPLPIIFISGRGDIQENGRSMKEGSVEFLQKPFSDTDLLAAIDQALARAGSYRQQGDPRAGVDTDAALS